jgi:membrane protease YdiL (CAAX protease family)
VRDPAVSGGRLLAALAVWVLLTAAGLAVALFGVREAGPDARLHRPEALAAWALGTYVALIVILAVAFRPHGLRRRLGFHYTSTAHVGLALATWLAALIVGALAAAALSPLLGEPDMISLRTLRLSSTPLFIGLLVPAVCVVGPAGEELLFRGALFAWLRRRIPVPGAIAVSAAIFAGAHGLPSLLGPLFVFGIATAWVYQQTGSTLNTFVMHAAQNTLALVGAYAVLARS